MRPVPRSVNAAHPSTCGLDLRRLDPGLRHYNAYGLTPGGLLANDDALFPEFRGCDLSSRGPARGEHQARDGTTIASLPAPARGLVEFGNS
jgi:hypothetical protein